jgi:hypothetical protein
VAKQTTSRRLALGEASLWRVVGLTGHGPSNDSSVGVPFSGCWRKDSCRDFLARRRLCVADGDWEHRGETKRRGGPRLRTFSFSIWGEMP